MSPAMVNSLTPDRLPRQRLGRTVLVLLVNGIMVLVFAGLCLIEGAGVIFTFTDFVGRPRAGLEYTADQLRFLVYDGLLIPITIAALVFNIRAESLLSRGRKQAATMQDRACLALLVQFAFCDLKS